MAVDIQQTGAIIGLIGNMGIPDFIIKRFGGHVVLSRIKMVGGRHFGHAEARHAYRCASIVRVAP